ncbi:aspartate carbamoyltransferase catalytic subunit [Gammaproteobacteria bacterium AB-CW1]|uniref:Aspartate carbamoyltransferase n=2 Tax=Natronospiraceae TaxID=3151664 RepID=A0AAP6ML45_9GAMM|nr:aspartate carbamoyltransferase catalytic subunit [Gammaproteobacteria bacterium AB-CW1]
MTQHLLAIDDLEPGQLRTLLDLARSHADADPQTESRTQLSGVTVAQLFYEPSTRTRCSFEIAARRLGADVLNLDINHTSTVKGETVVDTVRTLAAMGVRLFVIRHGDARVVQAAADVLPPNCHLLNAGAGTRQHPTQALLDMLTLMRAGFDFARLDISIVGDLRHSRVAASAVEALRMLGAASIRMGGPEGFLPDNAPAGVSLHQDLKETIQGAAVIMALRIQRERIAADVLTDPQLAHPTAYHEQWGLNEARVAQWAPSARVLHPGPMNRGVEIDDELADGPRSLILDQVQNGVAARMAALTWLFHGDSIL